MHKPTPLAALATFFTLLPLTHALPQPQPQPQDTTQIQLNGDVSALINPIPASTNLTTALADFTPLSAASAPPPLTAGTVTISIVSTAGPLPEDQIFVGLVASLALMYDKSLPPAQSLPGSGVTITFTAGLTHSIFVEPVLVGGGLKWLELEYTLKALGLQVFNRKLSTEILFDILINGQRRGRGGVTAKARTGDASESSVVPVQATMRS